MSVATIRNARRGIEQEQLAAVKSRGLPAVFIVDHELRVVHFHDDPIERRRNCRATVGSRSLPASLLATLRELKVRKAEDLPRLWTVADASLIVRTIPLHSFEDHTGLTTLIVERFKPRNYVNALATRYELSARETEVLQLLLRGATNEKIGSSLQIAPSTAIFHVKRLMAKTGARNRTELVARATE